MASVLNRTTKVYLDSANTPDYPSAEWIINPDISAVAGWSTGYWRIVGDIVSLLTQAERDAVDAAEREAQRDAAAQQLQQIEDLFRAFMLTVLDELNLHAAKHNAILTAIDNGANFSGLKANIALVADYPQRTEAQLRTAVRDKLGT